MQQGHAALAGRRTFRPADRPLATSKRTWFSRSSVHLRRRQGVALDHLQKRRGGRILQHRRLDHAHHAGTSTTTSDQHQVRPVVASDIAQASARMEIPAELEQQIDEVITHYPVSKRSAALPLLHLLQEHFRLRQRGSRRLGRGEARTPAHQRVGGGDVLSDVPRGASRQAPHPGLPHACPAPWRVRTSC